MLSLLLFSLLRYIVDTIIYLPGVWWIVNMAWLFLVSYMLLKLMKTLGEMSNGALTLRVQMDKKIKVDKWKDFVETKTLEVTDCMTDPECDTSKVRGEEEEKRRRD